MPAAPNPIRHEEDRPVGPLARVLLNPREAAEVLDVSERKLRDLTTPHGPIPRVKVGRLVKYRPAALEAFALAAETGGGPADV